MSDKQRSSGNTAVVIAVIILGILFVCGGLTVLVLALLLGTVYVATPMPAIPVQRMSVPMDLPVRLQIDIAGNLLLAGEPVSVENLKEKLATLQSSHANLHLQLQLADEAPEAEARMEQVAEILRSQNIPYSRGEEEQELKR